MRKTSKGTLFVGLLTLVTVLTPSLSYANSGAGAAGSAGFAETVGTHIYSPGPMVPAEPFKLEMQLMAPVMQAIHADMTMHPSVAGTQTIACTMQAVPRHRGMVILTCTPGS